MKDFQEPTMPVGMVEVTKERFFELLNADQRDIMPRCAHPTYSYWETKHRQIWGWTTPGWKYPGAKAQYAVVSSAVKP